MFSRHIGFFTILAFLLALGALYAMLQFQQKLSHPDVAIVVSKLQFQSTHSTIKAPVNTLWQPVALPHNWYYSKSNNNWGWYRYNFTVNVAPNRLWGIFLPTVQQNAAVYLNEELLGNGGSFSSPVARNWNRPLYFSIPNGLIRPGENSIKVFIKTNPANTGLLSKLFLGPEQDLKPYYLLKYFVRYTLTQFIIIILIFTSVLMLLLWWHRRHETINAWYALALIIWTVHNLNLVIIDIPWSARYWDWLMYISMIWFPVFATCFIQRFIGDINRSIEKLSFVIAILLCLILLLLPDKSFYWFGTKITNSIALVFGLYPVYRLYKYISQTPQQEAFLLMFTGFILVIFGLHDVLAINNLISRLDGFFLHYSAPPGLLLFAYILLKRFVGAINETEYLNRNLESQVRVKHQKLQQSYQQLKKIDRQRVLLAERERLMRDMHDGMGGHLVSTLALLESEAVNANEIREALQKALDDLRLMIDSMEDVNGDVLTILAMLRERLEPRLKQAGIKIDWKVTDLPALPELGPEKSLQLLRIFQEAITNVLKHANADKLTFETRPCHNNLGHPGVHIECRDNGCGITQKNISQNHSGRGLKNIQRRAENMGGTAGIENAEQGGVRVWLWLPQTG